MLDLNDSESEDDISFEFSLIGRVLVAKFINVDVIMRISTEFWGFKCPLEACFISRSMFIFYFKNDED